MTWIDGWGGVWVRVGSPARHWNLGVLCLLIEREPLRRAWARLVRCGSEVY